MPKHRGNFVFYTVSALQVVLVGVLISLIIHFVPKDHIAATALMVIICLVLFVMIGGLNIAVYIAAKTSKKEQ